MVRHLFLVSLCVSVMLPPNRQTDRQTTETDRPQTVSQTISQNERQSDRLLDNIQSVFMLALLSPTRVPPAECDVDSVQRTWTHLHSRLLRLEESWLLPPSEVRPQSWELKGLINTFPTQRKKGKKSVFSLRLIITSSEHKAFCCLFGVMGPPAGLEESSACLWYFLIFFSLSPRRWQTHLWGVVMEQRDVWLTHKPWKSCKPTSASWGSWDTRQQSG